MYPLQSADRLPNRISLLFFLYRFRRHRRKSRRRGRCDLRFLSRLLLKFFAVSSCFLSNFCKFSLSSALVSSASFSSLCLSSLVWFLFHTTSPPRISTRTIHNRARHTFISLPCLLNFRSDPLSFFHNRRHIFHYNENNTCLFHINLVENCSERPAAAFSICAIAFLATLWLTASLSTTRTAPSHF